MTKEEKKSNPLYSETAYDDAFRTIETKCDDVLIPFVNYFFNERYDKSAIINRLRNERFVENENDPVKKRITDSYFEIIFNGMSKKYHLECESKDYDESILIRIFEYDSMIAMDESEKTFSTLRVRFPYSGLLVLKGSEKTPNQAEVVLETPEGSIKYHIPIIKESDFTIEKIFEKQLYFLIPFYIFTFDKELKDMDEDDDKTDLLIDHYRKIFNMLEKEVTAGRLSAYSQSAIINIAQRVAYKFTIDHEHIQKKVGDFMGGQVLDIPELRVYEEQRDRGRAEGLAEGRAEGRAEGEAERKALKDENEALRKEIERLKAATK